MGVDSDGEEGKKLEAIKNPDAGMDVDNVVKEDGAAAVAGGGQEASAHAPAAEGVPQPVPPALPPNVEDEEEDWKFVPRKKRDEYGDRIAVMVWNVKKDAAVKFVRYLLNCATEDKIRVLPNAADKGDGLTHRFEYVELVEGGPRRRQIRAGIVAWEQNGRVATPSNFDGLEYRCDKGTGPRKVGETPRPVAPVQPSAPASKSTVLPKGVQVHDIPSGNAWSGYPPLPQQTKPTPMHNDAAYKRDLQEVQKEMQKLGLQVEQWLSSREADQNPEVPDEANTLLRQEMADLKEENGKLKEEQLRAAAAAEAAEATRLAQLAAQSQAHSVQMEKLEQALAELRARLEETITQMQAKNAEITRLVDQREAAAQEYWTPQKYVWSENDSDYDFENYKESDFEDEGAAKRAQRRYLAKLWKAAQHGEKEQNSKKKKSKQGQVTLHKRQGATPATHQAPVSGGSRRRDEIEPTGETPTQPTARSRSEEN